MFGQEPRLPVDFLLGRVQEPVSGRIHHWMEEHQARLQVAFEGARERLQAAAQNRKAKFDQRVREQPLTEGQLVYLREHGFSGRHKIQDLWSSIKYQVVRAPREGGSVYTVAPVHDLGKLRHVHRTSLKPCVRGSPAPMESLGNQSEQSAPLMMEDELEDGDVAYVVEAPPVSEGGAEVSRAPFEVGLTPASGVKSLASRPAVGVGESGVSLHLEPASVVLGTPNISGRAPRRTGRVGAGQHSNLYRLPRAVGSEANQISVTSTVGANSVVAWFRPWD